MEDCPRGVYDEDIRQRIKDLLREHGELCSVEIADKLGIDSVRRLYHYLQNMGAQGTLRMRKVGKKLTFWSLVKTEEVGRHE